MLDCKNTINQTLVYWIEKYIKQKINFISTRHVIDSIKLGKPLNKLAAGCRNIYELEKCIKEARNAGLDGLNVYFSPLQKLHQHVISSKIKSLKHIDENYLADFLFCITNGLSDATKKNYRMSLKNFFAFLDKQAKLSGHNHIFGVELKNWNGLKTNSGVKLPPYMTQEELTFFLKTLSKYHFTQSVNIRNKTIIKLIAFTGLRVGEASAIKLKDMSLQGNRFIFSITGKGNRPRVVVVRKKLFDKDIEALSQAKTPEDFLFANKHGNKINRSYIDKIIKQILNKANIRKQKNGAHMLRHTFATILYKKTKDILLVQEALGHLSIETVKIYTHLDSDRLNDILDVMAVFEKDIIDGL